MDFLNDYRCAKRKRRHDMTPKSFNKFGYEPPCGPFSQFWDSLLSTPNAPKDVRDFHIPFLSGRPNRETVIGQEDITNLLIALNTADSIETFYRMV